MSLVADEVERVLGRRPGLTVGQLMRELRTERTTARLPRGQVEDVLLRDPRFHAERSLGREVWHADPDDRPLDRAARLRLAPVENGAPLDGLPLWDWQVGAFGAWAAAGCRGVIEAVTGTGKTRVGLAATRAALARGGRVLVLVPTIDLMDQWAERLREHVPGALVGRLGAGAADDLATHHVVIATPHSAAPVPVVPPTGTIGLLVADEAHRYGTPTWGEALRPQFEMRLALTATYERNDDGLETVLGPYFGGVVSSYGYAEAAADGSIAPFRVALIGTELDEPERARYELADARVRQHHRELIDHGLPRAPMETIAAAARIVADAEPTAEVAGPLAASARAYLASLRARRDVAAGCQGKLRALRALAPSLTGRRTLVFSDTVVQAAAAAAILRTAGVPAEEVHGELPDRERRLRLARFADGRLGALAAPRVLDEGIDVPEAEVAVVLSAFRTRRQMIQRLGRVLRRKPGGEVAHLAVVFADRTREDPSQGAHRAFLDEIAPVALEVQRLDASAAPRDLAAWLVAGRDR
jgi:superfamily II DNA or RNA helicase